jgi:UDP-glucose:(heptosyl)LPS alpha-1,3-glucosyltransferase
MYFEYGGMQRAMLRIALECARRGHEVNIYTGKWLGKRPAAVQVRELDTRSLSNVRSNDKLARALATRVRSGNYDCVVGFTKIPGLDVYYAGDPCYAARIAESRSRFYRWLPRYRGFLRQEAGVFARGIDTEILLFALAEREKFITYYATEPRRFHLLPPGINRERLLVHEPDSIAAVRRELRLAADDLVIVTIASRFKTKGVDRSIKALAALPEDIRRRSKLVVIGEDNFKPYTRLAGRIGVADRVVFIGAREDIGRIYRAADLLLHPAYSENTGTVLIEAMICGLPVLTTGNCGFAFHVENARAGLICPVPFEQNTLNRLIGNALTSSERAHWKVNGPVYCESHDLYSLIERAADVIEARAQHNRSPR